MGQLENRSFVDYDDVESNINIIIANYVHSTQFIASDSLGK